MRKVLLEFVTFLVWFGIISRLLVAFGVGMTFSAGAATALLSDILCMISTGWIMEMRRKRASRGLPEPTSEYRASALTDGDERVVESDGLRVSFNIRRA